jgi:hypothetical protein
VTAGYVRHTPFGPLLLLVVAHEEIFKQHMPSVCELQLLLGPHFVVCHVVQQRAAVMLAGFRVALRDGVVSSFAVHRSILACSSATHIAGLGLPHDSLLRQQGASTRRELPALFSAAPYAGSYATNASEKQHSTPPISAQNSTSPLPENLSDRHILTELAGTPCMCRCRRRNMSTRHAIHHAHYPPQ